MGTVGQDSTGKSRRDDSVITRTYSKTHTRFTDGNGTTFRVLARFNPNEEDDPWVHYKNETTDQEYTCRLEAFLARFIVTPE
jgi:hypothetical protein